MTSAPGTLPALFIVVALLVLPPVLLVAGATRRLVRLRRRGRGSPGLTFALVGGVLGLAFNLLVAAASAPAILQADITWNRVHGAAAIVSWVAFWVWLVLSLRRDPRSRAY